MAITTRSSKTQTTGLSKSAQDEIAKLAYKFFQDRGHKHGNALDDWLKAEKMVRAKHGIK